MQEILEFGLFLLVLCSPILIVYLLEWIADIIVGIIINKK